MNTCVVLTQCTQFDVEVTLSGCLYLHWLQHPVSIKSPVPRCSSIAPSPWETSDSSRKKNGINFDMIIYSANKIWQDKLTEIWEIFKWLLSNKVSFNQSFSLYKRLQDCFSLIFNYEPIYQKSSTGEFL